MTTLRIAFIVILMAAPQAVARNATSPDVTIEAAELRDGATGASGPFSPGATVTATLTLRNRGDEAVTLHRIVLQPSEEVIVVDPVTDTLDNDGDGEADEADEAFQHRDSKGVAWRIGGTGLSLPPGERITRSLSLTLTREALPSTAGIVTVSAGSTLSEGEKRRPQKTEYVLTIPVTPPKLSLTAGEAPEIAIGTAPVVTGQAVFPGGILGDARITLDLPPAMQGDSVKSYRIGPAMTCETEPVPIVRGAQAVLQLGRCEIDGDQPAKDRTAGLSVSTTLTDAPADVTGRELDDWRTLSIYLGVWSDETLLGGKVVDRAMKGARILTDAVLPAGERYRVGDTVSIDLNIVNRGDEDVVEPRVTLLNGDTFECQLAKVAGEVESRPCKDGVVSLPTIESGDTLNLTMRLRLRDDALIDTAIGPKLEMTAGTSATYPFPVVPITMALHDGPTLTIADRDDWRLVDGVTHTTIGDRGRLRLTGSLPQGRYQGGVRLLARAVDARTGAPVAPVNLTIRDPELSITTADGKEIGKQTDYMTRTGTLWSQHILAFDLSDGADHADEIRRFTAELNVTVADVPGIAAGQVLEIVAETTAYGGNTAPGAEWIEMLVKEPDLRLKTFSLDEDRIIQPDETVGVVSLVCNYGDHPAFGVVLTLDAPRRIDMLSEKTTTRVFSVPLDTVRSGSLDKVDTDSAALSNAALEIEKRSVTLTRSKTPLDPEQCIGIEVQTPPTIDPADPATTATVLTSLDTYTGHADVARAREYPTARTSPLRFQIPAVSFGPSTTLTIMKTGAVEHPVELAVPDTLGPYRVALSPQSSTKLDWALFERREGRVVSWLNNAKAYPSGSTVSIVMRTMVPGNLPLGWVDTSRLKAVILTDDGRQFDASLRLVTRTGTGSARAITTDKLVALDRDCDGALADERVQDAVFEQGKDATPGDCLIVRIGFENTGIKEVERILIRDVVSSRTTLQADSVAVRIAPEPLDTVVMPDPATGTLEWVFKGLFRPGAVGEVEYRLRLDPI